MAKLHIDLLGIRIARTNTSGALGQIERLFEADEPALVAYANAHTLNIAFDDRRFHRILLDAPLVLNDGIGVQLAARMLGKRFDENLNGSDFNPRILELAAARGWTVFFLGAKPGVADAAAELLSDRIPALKVVGTHEGYLDPSQHAEVAEIIRETGADIVMVAMGNPLQEKWLAEFLPVTGARLGVGVGAFFDFTVGAPRRAPSWMNRIGIEWVYRLARQPARLWRRYLLGNPLFLWRAWRTSRRDVLPEGYPH
jgi:exopolysaccharide biosynthesis WecB/TagA/CpsF family protein